MHRDHDQEKVAFETTTFVWVWPGVSRVQSVCRNIWLSISGKKELIPCFLYWDSDQRKEHLILPLLDGCGQVCLLPIQIAGFSHQQFLWKESVGIFDHFRFISFFIQLFPHYFINRKRGILFWLVTVMFWTRFRTVS